MDQNLYLTDNEFKALTLLAEGKTNYVVRDACVIPLSGMAVFLSELRRKTGIFDTRKPAACQHYLDRYQQAMDGPGPTKDEKWAIGEYLNSKDATAQGIAYRLKITEAEALQLLENGFKAMGIFATDPRARRVQFKTYCTFTSPNELPRTPLEVQILEGIAEGMNTSQIADKLGQSIALVAHVSRDVLIRTGTLSRGRGVQQKLVRAFLSRGDSFPCMELKAKADAQALRDLMDDPAF